MKTNNIDFKQKPIRLAEISNSDYESFSNKSKNAYKMLSHSTNLKPNKKEGSIVTLLYRWPIINRGIENNKINN